jgi:hypothetical protein
MFCVCGGLWGLYSDYLFIRASLGLPPTPSKGGGAMQWVGFQSQRPELLPPPSEVGLGGRPVPHAGIHRTAWRQRRRKTLRLYIFTNHQPLTTNHHHHLLVKIITRLRKTVPAEIQGRIRVVWSATVATFCLSGWT